MKLSKGKLKVPYTMRVNMLLANRGLPQVDQPLFAHRALIKRPFRITRNGAIQLRQRWVPKP